MLKAKALMQANTMMKSVGEFGRGMVDSNYQPPEELRSIEADAERARAKKKQKRTNSRPAIIPKENTKVDKKQIAAQ